MSNWRDRILREFTPNVARLTLVADPDGLLLEEDVLAGVRARGFELIPFEDHIAFRDAYESRFRSRWDQGERTELVVVLRSAVGDLGFLPYDLLQAGRRLSFTQSRSWLAIGIRTDEQADRTLRVDGLLDTLASTIPNVDTRHDEWFHFAKTWAELVALTMESDEGLPEPARRKMEALQNQIDAVLIRWLRKRYAGLVNLPPVLPVMLHHIPRFLSRHVSGSRENKVAFVLVDGLSLDQWIVIRKELTRQRPRYRFRENAVFAWIPTITSVSRQAAFSGKPPIYFPNSIHTTDKEPALWTQFWVDQGLTQQEVAYAKGLGDGAKDSVEEMIARPRTRVVGLVVDKVDKIMHSMALGAAGMHNQVRQWAGQPFMANLVDGLLENGFRIYLASDHGNIEATGCGRPAEGSVADLRGERARIYPDSLLRSRIKERFPAAFEWPPIGLPEDYLPLLAPGRSAFVHETERLVGHGGASLEELIVPLVQIERRDT